MPPRRPTALASIGDGRRRTAHSASAASSPALSAVPAGPTCSRWASPAIEALVRNPPRAPSVRIKCAHCRVDRAAIGEERRRRQRHRGHGRDQGRPPVAGEEQQRRPHREVRLERDDAANQYAGGDLPAIVQHQPADDRGEHQRQIDSGRARACPRRRPGPGPIAAGATTCPRRSAAPATPASPGSRAARCSTTGGRRARATPSSRPP